MTPAQSSFPGAASLAQAVRTGYTSAVNATTDVLRRIDRFDGLLNCFTAVLRDSALAQAAEVDRRLAAGEDPGPMGRVPVAGKNPFDIAGLTTAAGAKIHAAPPPAAPRAPGVGPLTGARPGRVRA